MSDDTPQRERPFRIIDGRKWVLAEGEPLPAEELEQAEDPEIMGRIDPPPRAIPFFLGLDLRLRSGSVPLMGWFFMGFALIFLIVAAVMGFDDAVPRPWQPAGRAVVTQVEETNTTVNDTKIYRYRFRQETPNGVNIEGISHGTGGRHKTGDEVDLERAGDRYRINDLTLSVAGPLFPLIFGGVASVFFLIGLCFPIAIYRNGSRAARLLRDGETTKAVLLGMEPTGTQINGRSVMKAEFEYHVDGTTYRTHAKALDTSRLTDDTYEVVFYDPLDPARAVVLDALPEGVALDDITGRFTVSPFRCLPELLAATIVAGELVAVVVLLLRSV